MFVGLDAFIEFGDRMQNLKVFEHRIFPRSCGCDGLAMDGWDVHPSACLNSSYAFLGERYEWGVIPPTRSNTDISD